MEPEQLDLFDSSFDESEEQPSDLNPRQWATYRLVRSRSLLGGFCTQREIVDNYPKFSKDSKGNVVVVHEDGYCWVENSSHGDHCRTIISDVYAINESYEIMKILVAIDYQYRLGTEEECADYYWRMKISGNMKEHRAAVIKSKMKSDGQGQLLSRRLKAIYDSSDKKTKRFIETYITEDPQYAAAINKPAEHDGD